MTFSLCSKSDIITDLQQPDRPLQARVKKTADDFVEFADLDFAVAPRPREREVYEIVRTRSRRSPRPSFEHSLGDGLRTTCRAAPHFDVPRVPHFLISFLSNPRRPKM